MAKQGQHHGDGRDQDRSPGHNNPSKSITITTGTPKKKETYRKQALAHEDPDKQAQNAKHEWDEAARERQEREDGMRARRPRSGRSGSDSNANSGTRGH